MWPLRETLLWASTRSQSVYEAAEFLERAKLYPRLRLGPQEVAKGARRTGGRMLKKVTRRASPNSFREPTTPAISKLRTEDKKQKP